MSYLNDEKLSSIIRDNKSGSQLLLLELNKWIANNIDSIENIEEFIHFLLNQFASFQNIESYLNNLLRSTKQNNTEGIKIIISETEYRFNTLPDILFNKGVNFFQNLNKIVTLSNSYTVLQFLLKLNEYKNKLVVAVSESRPVNEGRVLAQYLLEHNVKVNLITEAIIADTVCEFDAALIGADKVLGNGNIINKVGSKVLAINCKHYNKPFYVIADKTKFSNNNQFNCNPSAPQEIWENEHKNLTINNYYFEEVDRLLISELISD